jgi:hypothetical protein
MASVLVDPLVSTTGVCCLDGISDKMECFSGGGVLVAGLEGVCETSLGETDSSGVKWRKLGRTGEGSLGE